MHINYINVWDIHSLCYVATDSDSNPTRYDMTCDVDFSSLSLSIYSAMERKHVTDQES